MSGSGAVRGLRVPIALPLQAPLDPLLLAPDELGGVFLLVAGSVVAITAVYGIGYASGPAASRSGWAAFAVFALGMQLVPAAADVVSFLLAWELMAVGSTILVLADHRLRASVVPATLSYAVMTHLSFLLLLGGFSVLVSVAGGTSFAALAGAGVTGGAASVAFVLLLAGFATKAGLVPLHVWLPRAHPEAPSHVSAAMSAAMVKMGVYGVLLVLFRLLPAGPSWWAVLLLVLALGSALYGILQASVTSDLKRLLAYSTTENVGLILTAVAVAVLLNAAGQPGIADVALTAALLLVVSHAAFKTVLFLGAGSVLHATGERNLDRLGGLARTMPVTSVAFGVAALGAAALPVTSGFAAEWVLLQSLIHGERGQRPAGRGGAAGHGGSRGADGRAGAAHLRQGLRDRLPRPTPLRGGRPRPRGQRPDARGHAHRHGGRGRPGPGPRTGGLGPGRGCRRIRCRGGRAAGRVTARRVRAAGPRGPDPAGGGGGRPRRRGSGGRGPPGTAPRRRAGVGVRGGPGEPHDAVHGHVVRRAAGSGVRRRPAAAPGPAGHPRRRVPLPGVQGPVPPAGLRCRRPIGSTTLLSGRR